MYTKVITNLKKKISVLIKMTRQWNSVLKQDNESLRGHSKTKLEKWVLSLLLQMLTEGDFLS